LNQWAHLAATLSNGTGRIYINGTLVGSGPLNTPDVVARTNNFLGRSNWGADAYADAIFEEVRLWNVARSPAELAATMNQRVLGSPAALLACYRLDEGAGPTAASSGSGGGYDGTLANGVAWVVSTVPFEPEVRTGDAIGTYKTTATVDGTVNPGNLPTVAWFEWGTNTDYTYAGFTNLVTDSSGDLAISTTLTHLVEGMAYHFRVVASNRTAFAFGEDRQFTTEQGGNTVLPTIRITSPVANQRFTNSLVTVTGTDGDDATVSAIYYRFNDGSYNSLFVVTNGPWEVTANGLVPGTNVVQAFALDDAGNASLIRSVPVLYHVSASLSLTFHPTNGGTLPGLTNGQILEVGRNYLSTPKPAAGLRFDGVTYGDGQSVPQFDAAAPVRFRMVSGGTLDVFFATNQLAPAAGTYYGLLLPDAQTGDSNESPFNGTNAAFAQVTVTSAGKCSGKLTFPNTSISFSAPLTADGHGHIFVLRSAPLAPIDIPFDLGSLTPPILLTGRMSSPFAATLQASRGIRTNSCAGRYTFFIPPAEADGVDFPGGSGAGAINISTQGRVSMTGHLADGSAINISAPATESGDIPLYTRLYGKLGVFIGFARCGSHTNANFDPGLFPFSVPELAWTKPPGATPRDALYREGFRYQGELLASVYTPPPTGPSTLRLTNDVFTAQFGNLDNPLVASLVYTNGKLAAPSLTNQFSLRITPASGLFSGSFRHPATGKSRSFLGALQQLVPPISGIDLIGYGSFLGTNQAGGILFR
jgi:hypothetical protein